MELDALDRSLVRVLLEEPRAGSREYARILGVARGTVQSRLARLERGGVITSYQPQIATRAMGFDVDAFVQLQLAQGRLDQVTAGLAAIPEVLQAYSTTGEGDLLCHVVARDNSQMEQIVQVILTLPGVVRSRTEIALKERVPYRVLPLLQRAATEG